MGIDCLTDEQLSRLTEISRFVNELANVAPNRYQPYVGVSAFAHKGGVHAAAVKEPGDLRAHQPGAGGQRSPDPGLRPLGQEHHLPQGQGAGSEPAAHDQAVQFALDKMQEVTPEDLAQTRPEALQVILERIKDLEAQGYQFESAEASMEMVLRAALGQHTGILPAPELPGGRPEGG